MVVRDSCSKQLDSDRLAADVPGFSPGKAHFTLDDALHELEAKLVREPTLLRGQAAPGDGTANVKGLGVPGYVVLHADRSY